MSLEKYFIGLIKRVEESDIHNDGKNKDGFFEPTRATLLQRLNLLKDLHNSENANAKAMIQGAWRYVVEHLPPDWLVLSPEEKSELKKVLSSR